jgi:hypothetical protein
MISERTVFVLGAGASQPYGFPLASELHDLICSNTVGGDLTNLKRFLVANFRLEVDEIRDFGRQFQRSQIGTIDEFLGRHPDLENIGKLAIAYFLCGKEDRENIHALAIEDNWYQALWKTLIAGAQSPADLAKNQVKFVTFNYDRSLEYFLHDATKHTFRIDDASAFSAWSKIEISHVYGQLGKFGIQPGAGSRQYSNQLSEPELRIAAQGIVIIPEARADDGNFASAHEWFSHARRICFLGFHFDELNVKRLRLAEILRGRVNASDQSLEVYASTLGRTTREIDSIRDQLGPVQFWHPISQKSLVTLRHSPILLH